MCVMEIRPGQRSATMAQAMAHNVRTICSDLDLFKPILEARGEDEALTLLNEAKLYMDGAYERFLHIFADEVTHEITGKHPDYHDEIVGNEREHVHVSAIDHRIVEEAAHLGRPGMKPEFVAEATIDAHRAEKFESR